MNTIYFLTSQGEYNFTINYIRAQNPECSISSSTSETLTAGSTQIAEICGYN